MVRAHYTVLSITIMMPVFLATTYTISVVSGHVEPFLPFISYTGNYPIESCIFSFAINLTAANYLLIVVLRYDQIANAIESQPSASENMTRKMNKRNIASLASGVAGAGGISVVGSFQQRLFQITHVCGVLFLSFGSITFFALQTYFSFTLMAESTSRTIKALRLSIVVLGLSIHVIAFCMFVYFLSIDSIHIHGFFAAAPPKKGAIHTWAAVLEWILFSSYLLFIFTFYWDFKKIELKKDQVLFPI